MSVFETGVAISKSYSKVKEIVIESCALYSASLLAYIILTAKKDPNLSYPENIHPQIAVSCSFCPYRPPHLTSTLCQGIVPTLLIYRVASGESRPNSSWTKDNSRPLTGIFFAATGTGTKKDGISRSLAISQVSQDPSVHHSFEDSGSPTAVNSKGDPNFVIVKDVGEIA